MSLSESQPVGLSELSVSGDRVDCSAPMEWSSPTSLQSGGLALNVSSSMGSDAVFCRTFQGYEKFRRCGIDLVLGEGARWAGMAIWSWRGDPKTSGALKSLNGSESSMIKTTRYCASESMVVPAENPSSHVSS